jgi:hypothetical protein
MRRLEICKLFDISARTFDRQRAEGKVPPPDHRIGRIDMWSPELVEAMFRIETPPSRTRKRTAATK